MTAPIAGGGDLPGDDDNRGTNPAAPSGGHLFSLRAKVFDADDLRRAHTRIAHEIVERNHGATDVVLIGLYTRGVAVAHRLAEAIERFEGVAVPVGAIDVAFYRDDIGLRRIQPLGPTEVPVDVTGRGVVLVGDVLCAAGIGELLDLSDSFVEVTRRDIPKIPALRGKTVVTLFYEDSTRTRLSFETAAKRLTADTMSFTAASSAVGKGESLLDTVRTIEAMGVDAMVVRHQCAGAPHRIASWIDAAVVNAGDGRHEHPTQALLDLLTLRRRLGSDSFRGLRVGIVGDVRHSRVARSGVKAFAAVGADVTVVGPPTLLPESLEGLPARA